MVILHPELSFWPASSRSRGATDRAVLQWYDMAVQIVKNEGRVGYKVMMAAAWAARPISPM
jgi:hypothetical protein